MLDCMFEAFAALCEGQIQTHIFLFKQFKQSFKIFKHYLKSLKGDKGEAGGSGLPGPPGIQGEKGEAGPKGEAVVVQPALQTSTCCDSLGEREKRERERTFF